MSLVDAFRGRNQPQLIPDSHLIALSPATYYLREWDEYLIEAPLADRVLFGSMEAECLTDGLFRYCFKNQLGLTTINAFTAGKPLGDPLQVEVISPKFPTLTEHIDFYRSLLNDLFTRAARLPFTISSDTSRSVTEALRPPTPLFTLHFLCQYAPTLRDALAIILAAPHRQLHDNPDLVSLAEVTEADADVLLGILHAPERWVRATGFPLAERLKDRAPTHVWQRRPEETTDTPENRFVLAFLRQVLIAAETLPRQRWWKNVQPERQAIILEATGLLRQAMGHPTFADLGPLHHLPLASQVLLRRDGYREMLDLWRRFHQARRPLFAPLQHAMDVRDVATLYEFWVFFVLTKEIDEALGEKPVVNLRLSDEGGLEQPTEARFGQAGTLVYNQYQPSYSVPLRPDFTWKRNSQAEVVFDAKFRLERLDIVGEDGGSAETTAKRADLYKMHTYRDALRVRAAVAVYPRRVRLGEDMELYPVDKRSPRELTLRDLLLGDWAGIGALARKPCETER